MSDSCRCPRTVLQALDAALEAEQLVSSRYGDCKYENF